MFSCIYGPFVYLEKYLFKSFTHLLFGLSFCCQAEIILGYQTLTKYMILNTFFLWNVFVFSLLHCPILFSLQLLSISEGIALAIYLFIVSSTHCHLDCQLQEGLGTSVFAWGIIGAQGINQNTPTEQIYVHHFLPSQGPRRPATQLPGCH